MTSMSLFRLTGQVACVTGASSGIGKAIASTFSRAGASVVGVARREDALKQWHDGSKNDVGETAYVVADVSDIACVGNTASAVSKPFGPVDILVNAAGLNPRKSAGEISPAVWQQTIDLNLTAPFFLAQALVPSMQKKGWGRIINIASLQSERAFPNGISYGASKGGVAQLTRAMAEAWSSVGIGCNALAPGFFPTELTQAVFEDVETASHHANQTCIGRNGKLSDLDGPAIFLASPASDYVTGQVLYVDGGYTAK